MPVPQLRDQLQKSLGQAYTIRRELGGGGMSRVFVAEETVGRMAAASHPPALAGSDGKNSRLVN